MPNPPNIETSLLEPDKPPPRLSFDLGAIEAFKTKKIGGFGFCFGG
jgi:hypothetical protein